MDNDDGRGRIDIDIAARAPDTDIVAGRHNAEAEQAEQDGDNPEGGLSQLIAEFKGRDFGEHNGVLPIRRRQGRGARR